MLYRVLADVVLVVHVGFVLFVIFGGLLALRWRWAPLAHLPAAAWGVWIELVGGVCPLTPLEQRLRDAAGGGTYEDSFIEHYLTALLYPGWLNETTQVLLGVGLLLVNALVYGWVLYRWRRRRRPA